MSILNLTQHSATPEQTWLSFGHVGGDEHDYVHPCSLTEIIRRHPDAEYTDHGIYSASVERIEIDLDLDPWECCGGIVAIRSDKFQRGGY